jgi:hypothetical protein
MGAACVAATTSLGLGACGGSGSGRATVVVVQPSAARAVVTTPTPRTGVTTAPAQFAGASASHAATVPSATESTRPAANQRPHVINVAKLPPAPGDATVQRCMRTNGLVRVTTRQTGIWSGLDPVVLRPVFVDGPYKTTHLADDSVQSLAGLQQAMRGGHFVVSAAPRSNLLGAVLAVAKCLNGAGA